jgi:hypothetical protein
MDHFPSGSPFWILLGSFKGTTKEEKDGKEPEVFRKINPKLIK